MSSVESLLTAFGERTMVPWKPDEPAAGRVWILWYDNAQERRVRGRIGEFREIAERAGKGWTEFDLASEFARWIARQKWFERAARKPNTLSTVLPQFEDELVARVRETLSRGGPNDIFALTGVASLFGIMRASSLIARVAEAIPGRMLVTFPGTHQNGIYRLLDARDGWNYLAIPIPPSDAA